MSLGQTQLTPQLIQAVRDAIDIVEVAGKQIRLEKKGDRFWGLCPFHKEKTPSFSVEPVKGLYYCFGCGAGGDAIRLHMLTSGDDFPAAIETLARENGIALPSASGGGAKGGQRDLEQALLAAEDFFVGRLGSSKSASGYLHDRKIPEALVESFRLGFAPDDFQALLGSLRQRFSLDDLEAAGLIGRASGSQRPYDRFRNRLMFPVRNPSGRLVGFGGRTLGDDRAKYINSRETDRFQKRLLLYGLDAARRSVREGGRVLLVEGYFDLLAAVASGIDWVVATMGTALSTQQARLCSRYADTAVLCYDGDAAGQEAHSRALPILLAQGLEVKWVELGEDRDPDSLRLEQGGEALCELVEAAVDGVEKQLERIVPRTAVLEPGTRSRAAKVVTELLDAIPDAVMRFGYAQSAADRLGVPPELLRAPTARRRTATQVEPERAAEPVQRKEVMSLEEKIVHLLLREETEVPPLADLPPAEAFENPLCGNIFVRFCALYKEEARPPDARAVLDSLSRDGESLDRVARILLEEAPCSGESELADSLHLLSKSWQRRQLKKLAIQIREAARLGETGRLEQLVEEKTALTRQLHELGTGG